jgi:uncharacterized heparinase superfamily protein
MVVNMRSTDGRFDVAGATVTTALNHARNRSYASWIYDWSLKGPMPDRVLYSPQLPITPSAQKADAFLLGQYTLPGGQVKMTSGTPWQANPPNRQWAENLHGFSWLWHFNAKPGKDTSRHARWLIKTWLDEHKKCRGLAWRPQVLARRLISWYANWPLITEGADMIWRSTLLRSMARQAKHLHRTAKSTPDGLAKLEAALGLTLTGIAMPNQSKCYERGLSLLARELASQVTADGAHVSRSPETLLMLLCDLLMLREAMFAGGHQVPSRLQHTIDRMAPAVDFFRHGDGHLSLFNDGGIGEESAIEKALAGDETKPTALSHLPYSGFHRFKAKRTLVLVDTGTPPRGAHSLGAHAGCLSFEMSAGRHRLITNCGALTVQGPNWHQAMRATAAHSTLGLDTRSSAQFIDHGLAVKLLGPRLSNGPSDVESARHEKDIGIWLDASHDGYLAPYGLLHARRLFLSADGNDLRGEDMLMAKEGRRTKEAPQKALVRFHLHPDVRASLARDGSNVLLLLPNRDGWQFKAKGGAISLEESVYIGDGETVRRSNQIVITAEKPTHETKVNWAFRRLEGDKK